MKKINFMDLSKMGAEVESDIFNGIVKVMSHHQFINGPEKKEFEGKWANYCGVKHCIGVDNGMSALELSLRAMGIGSGCEVITVPNTYYSTVRAITKTGAKPVLVDVDPRTYNMDPERARGAITPLTRAILPVHLYGQPADMTELNGIAASHGIDILEDACQAHGADYYIGFHGHKTGSLGTMGAFSFYPGKNLGSFGDAGAVTTDSDDLAERVRLLHNHGMKVRHEHLVQGDNHRLDSLQAAVLNVKLPHLDQWNKQRQNAARIYNHKLTRIEGVKKPYTNPGRTHVNHLYVIHVENRDEMMKYLADNGITVGLHYPNPIHMQPAFANLGYKQGDFPISEESSRTLMSLPMFPGITEEEISYVCDKIKDCHKPKVYK